MRYILLAIIILFIANHACSQVNRKNLTYRSEDFLERVTQEYAEVFRSYQFENGKFLVKDYYLDGKLRGIAEDRNGMTHGLYIGYYKDGTLRDSGYYHKSLRWGAWKTFHKNGKLKILLSFKDDYINGMAYWYDSLGNLIIKKDVKKGNVKSWVEYFPGTTKIKKEFQYVDGKRDGEVKMYFEDGRLKRSALYREGNYVEGSGKLYNEEGAEIPYTPVYTPISFKGELTKYILSNMHYPQRSMENNVEGIVYVRAEIDEKGDVRDAAISKGMNEECNEEALRLVKTLKFSPPTYDNEALPCVQRIRVPFYITAFLKQQYLDKEKENQEMLKEIEDNSNPFK